ncbi:MAG: hypothetical protein US50_C0039G0002 [Candidatus Nomurabacteria bacterium GW2011_GWB1_37_5]|uniref:PPM-type phosphatase domain-containing protein n=1 Tax=Candidatus Nomurabacteria bacterium GW2011_GWB1_37_5 TaxID=1618742 RepID=A0A0G0K248_9BACT|nr:MAG: hypothetical protein US50_C0039G0002 [Candidatus Nomurabacteria bacterium GW2011_GWB1_37_5]
MKNTFKITGGTVPGTDHTMPGEPSWKNNQDAFHLEQNDLMTLGLIADGCSNGEHSEVGSKIAIRLLGQSISRLLPRYLERLNEQKGDIEYDFFERVREDLLANIRVLANQMGESLSKIISEYFLFTIVGALITKEQTYFFSLGDGYIVKNGEVERLGPFPNNMPPYLSYSFFDNTSIQFKVRFIETEKIESILLASDGAEYLIKSEGLKNPNGMWTIKPLSDFWTDDVFIKKNDAIRGRLALYNKEHPSLDSNGVPWIKRGPLKDDTTIIVIRKIKC